MSEIPEDGLPTPDTDDDVSAAWPDTNAEHWPTADWQALADFLTRAGSPEALAATTHRLQTDAVFARLAAPLLRFWDTPLPGSDVDVDAAWAAIERRADARRRAHVVAPSPAATQSPVVATAPTRTTRPLGHAGRGHWRRLSVNPLWAIAVLLILIAGYTTLEMADRSRERAMHCYTKTGTTHTILLADGSRVTLAPGATLVADGVTAGTQTSASRTVHLDGTGTFVVHADPTHPFIVETHEIAAVALGTVFAVTVQPSGAGKSGTPTSSSSNTPPPTGDAYILA